MTILDGLFAIIAGVRVDQTSDRPGLLSSLDLESSKDFPILDEDDCGFLAQVVAVCF